MARRQFLRRSGARPNRAWASTTAHTTFTTVPAASKVLISTFALLTEGIDLTILRTVGRFNVTSDQSAGVEVQIGAWGLIIVTDLAAAAGIASIPGAFTDADDDGWYTHQMFSRQGVINVTSSAGDSWEFDSKAKRILNTGHVVAVVAENAGAQGLQINIQFRMLTQIRGTR